MDRSTIAHGGEPVHAELARAMPALVTRGLPARERSPRGWALSWISLVLLLPLALLATEVASAPASPGDLALLLRVLLRGLGLAAVVATLVCAAGLLLARTVPALALLAPVLIARSLTAYGVLAIGLEPGVVAVVTNLIIDLVPLAALLLTLRLRARPWALLDAAADLGAGWWSRLRWVDWPHLRPALAVVWVWSALQVLGDAVALEIAGGGKVYGPGLLIRDALIHDGAPARALLGILVLLAAALPCARALTRELDLARGDAQLQRAQPLASPRWRGAGWLLWLLLLAVPAAALIGPHPRGIGAHDRLLASLLTQTLSLAAVVAVIAGALGLAAAIALRRRGPGRDWSCASMLLPVAVPDSVFGLLTLGAAAQLGVEPGAALTVVALLPTALALALLVMLVLSSTIPDAVLEAAADLGADARRRLRWIWLPLGRPALLIALLLVFAWVLGQATIPSFTSGPGGDTLAVGLTVLARGGAWPVVRRWSLALILIPTITAVAIHLLARLRPGGSLGKAGARP